MQRNGGIVDEFNCTRATAVTAVEATNNLFANSVAAAAATATATMRMTTEATEPTTLRRGDSVDRLRQRFHAHRRKISQNDRNDVAVVFVSDHVCALMRQRQQQQAARQSSAVVQSFRESNGAQLFAPFDSVTRQSFEDAICYVLRRNTSNGGDFDAYYCGSGSPNGATMHYRVEFEALLGKLFESGYKYIMKPVVIDRCVDGAAVASNT